MLKNSARNSTFPASPSRLTDVSFTSEKCPHFANRAYSLFRSRVREGEKENSKCNSIQFLSSGLSIVRSNQAYDRPSGAPSPIHSEMP